MISSSVARSTVQPLTGYGFDETAFRFVEASAFNPDLVLDVLEGRRAGVVFRGFVLPSDCDRIGANFWEHPDRYTRGKDAPAEYVGTYHYRKPLDLYFTEAERFGARMDDLFRGGANPPRDFIAALAGALAPSGTAIRPASHDGRTAGRFVMRSWTDTGAFALDPHDDEAQCRDPLQAGFEIQQAAENPLVAVNMCLENGSGGALYYWNIIPDEASRNRLGLTVTGSPYPIEMLDGIEYQIVPIHAGDLYCFNGKAVHGVSALSGRQGRRATIAFLMGRLDERTVIYWT